MNYIQLPVNIFKQLLSKFSGRGLYDRKPAYSVSDSECFVDKLRQPCQGILEFADRELDHFIRCPFCVTCPANSLRLKQLCKRDHEGVRVTGFERRKLCHGSLEDRSLDSREGSIQVRQELARRVLFTGPASGLMQKARGLPELFRVSNCEASSAAEIPLELLGLPDACFFSDDAQGNSHGNQDSDYRSDCLHPSREIRLPNRRGGRLTRNLRHRRVDQCPAKEATEGKSYGTYDQCVAVESILLRSRSHSPFSGSFEAVAISFTLAAEPCALVCLVDLGGWRNAVSVTGIYDGLIVPKSADQEHQSNSEEYQQRIENESENACRFLLDIPPQSFVKSPDCQDHPYDADDETHSENTALPVDRAGDGFGVISGYRCTSIATARAQFRPSSRRPSSQ
ncbi:hypothetical protein [Xanthomonas cannabis]|uniref:hypothetical protein n=1 Tax=Xanthomonas cannabis TaxID=1885674 RepID=UPI0011111D05|nr:hypothetical protein [Xanthomonas cannabis]